MEGIDKHIGCQNSSVPTRIITIMENRVRCNNLSVSVDIAARHSLFIELVYATLIIQYNTVVYKYIIQLIYLTILYSNHRF